MSDYYSDFQDNMSGDKVLIIPAHEKTRIALLNVDRHTKSDLRRQYGLHVASDWGCNTTATVTMLAVIEILYKGIVSSGIKQTDYKGTQTIATLDFYNLIEIGITKKSNDRADKTGNINVAFQLGSGMIDIITNDVKPSEKKDSLEDYIQKFSTFYEDDPMNKAFIKIDKNARLTLSKKHGLIYPQEMIAITILHTTIINIIKELITILTRTGKKAASINFNDVMEFHAEKKPKGVIINIRPGMYAKLGIKSDATTEDEDDFYED